MIQVLLDSDIILDLVLKREPHFPDALEVFKAIARERFAPYVTAIALLNVNYFAEKEQGRHFALVEIQNLLSLLTVCSTDAFILNLALASPIDDFEDAVQHESAIVNGLDGIVTRNLKDFENASLSVYSPKQFLTVLEIRNE